MTGAVAGNARVVEQLFRKDNTWLRSWVTRRSRYVSAEDVASEVFLRLLVLPYVGELREPRAMMTTIASRIISELRRRGGLWRALEAELSIQPSFAPSPEEKLLITEALREIDSILKTQCPKARAAFLLSRVDGMTQQEIARQLGVSTRTVERYLGSAASARIRGCDPLVDTPLLGNRNGRGPR